MKKEVLLKAIQQLKISGKEIIRESTDLKKEIRRQKIELAANKVEYECLRVATIKLETQLAKLKEKSNG